MIGGFLPQKGGRGRFTALNVRMEKRSIRLAATLLMVAAFLCGAVSALADADPIRVSSLSEPQSVLSEQDVSITIKIYNNSQTDMEETITLFNPDRYAVDKYEGLKGENSVTYTGTWRVTDEEIAKGKIVYYIRYNVQTDNGPTETVRTIPVTIQAMTAAPELTATYSVSPVAAREGQTVNVAYTLSNIGNIELRNIVVENEGISKESLTVPSLSVGEKVTLEDSFTMGNRELVSKPSVTYQASGSDKKLTISDMARKTITVAEDGLDVMLKAADVKSVYPGESVSMTLELKNSGNTAYTGISAELSDGTPIASGVELAPGAAFKQEFTAQITRSGEYSVSVSGRDSSGEIVSVASGALEITTQDPARALMLKVQAQAQTQTIYSEPAVIRFGVMVENVGQTDATTLTIKQNGTTVGTIPSLPFGESRTVVFDVETSIAGKFQFVVSGRDDDGNERAYESNIIQVNYLEPTPVPTSAPTPTPVPPTPSPAPTATPKPSLGEIISQSVNPVVLYTIAGVLAAAIAAVLILSGMNKARKERREKNAIDTIELTPDVRNHRGLRRRRQAKEKKAEDVSDAPVVPMPELTDENPVAQEDASDEPKLHTRREREESRRRAVQEFPLTADETLRVVPVEERPEFIAQGRVDDSQTRIFGRIDEEETLAATAHERPTGKNESTETPEETGTAEKVLEAKAESAQEETIRLSRNAIEEETRRKTAAKAKGSKRSEIKPLKKKKKGLFSFVKEEEDDFEEPDDDFGDGDDDFIE